MGGSFIHENTFFTLLHKNNPNLNKYKAYGTL